jgi:hypothetical protein
MPVIYKLRIPKPDTENEYEEFIFKKAQDILEKLSISKTTFYRIINKTLKCNTIETNHLKGIIIEKEFENNSVKDILVKTENEIKINEFRKNIIEKLKIDS